MSATLLPQHQALLDGSGIALEVAEARGYRSIQTNSELLRLGFGRNQGSVPALYLPLHGVRGAIAGHQIRPDRPRQGADGRIVKYETPAGVAVALDVHPHALATIGDPGVPLVITEGIRKGDSAVSRGICCIALIGVWSWRGRNEQGGLTALADWEQIALKKRRVLVAFDSDVTTKPAVFGALKRLKAFLEARGASVEIVHLPPGTNNSKCGLDDFLVQGKSYDDLVRLARTDLPPDPVQERVPAAESDYRVGPDGLFHVQFDHRGLERLCRLTNFLAKISASITEDDGQEQTRRFEILAERDGVQRVVRVAAAEFSSLSWVPEKLGAEFVVAAGLGVRDHARAAIQFVSAPVPERHVYTHTGWCRFGGDRGSLGQWGYLHAGGAIGGAGEQPLVEVQLQQALEGYALPTPPLGDALRSAIRSSLEFLAVARAGVAAPLFAATYRAPLGNCNFSVHLEGKTGTGKTELAALSQQHFGPTMDAGKLPGSWSSTGNALEAVAFFAKDAVFAVDDFVPQGSAVDVARGHRDADRVLRAQGNRSGRQRLRADGSIQAARAPRGLFLSTGEDVPAGHSLRARMFVVELRESDVDWNVLTQCQRAAREGEYAAAMAGFIAWLVPQRDELEERVRSRAAELRTLMAARMSGSHKRTPHIAAQLVLGIEYFLEFAHQTAAITDAERDRERERLLAAILDCTDGQFSVQAQSDPVEMFLRLVRSAVAAGEGHVAMSDGAQPSADIAGALGWRGNSSSHELRPQGERMGWLEGTDLYLIGPVAYRAAQKFGSDIERLTLTQHALGRRLDEANLLLSTDAARHRLTVRRQFSGARVDALHLSAGHLLELPHRPQSPRIGLDAVGEGDSSGAVREAASAPSSVIDTAQRPSGVMEASVCTEDQADYTRSAWEDVGDGRGAL